jgi:hypothetical protein
VKKATRGIGDGRKAGSSGSEGLPHPKSDHRTSLSAGDGTLSRYSASPIVSDLAPSTRPSERLPQPRAAAVDPNETTPAGETPPSSLELGELLSCGAL